MHTEKQVKDTPSRMFQQLEKGRAQQFRFVDNRGNVPMHKSNTQKENTVHYLSFDNRNNVYQRNFDLIHTGVRNKNNKKTKNQLNNRLLPIQCTLIYNNSTYNNIETLQREQQNISMGSIIKVSHKNFKGGNSVKKEAIKNRKIELWNLFVKLIADPSYSVTVSSHQDLYQAILNYESALQTEDNSVQKIDDPKIEKYIQEGRLFPINNVAGNITKVNSNHGEVARGFSYELSLAVSALEQDSQSYVQMGAIQNFETAPDPVREAVSKEQSALIFHKRIGADVVVWQPANQINTKLDPLTYGADFVQAKCCKFDSACKLMKQAKNQLEGTAASGKTVATSDKECTLIGQNYMGSIFISIIDDIKDINTLEKCALKCIDNKSVHSVVIEAKDGTKYFYHPGGCVIRR